MTAVCFMCRQTARWRLNRRPPWAFDATLQDMSGLTVHEPGMICAPCANDVWKGETHFDDLDIHGWNQLHEDYSYLLRDEVWRAVEQWLQRHRIQLEVVQLKVWMSFNF